MLGSLGTPKLKAKAARSFAAYRSSLDAYPSRIAAGRNGPFPMDIRMTGWLRYST
jgi:hypothetical protein